MQEPIIVCAGVNRVSVQPFNTIGELITLTGKLNAIGSATVEGETAKMAVTHGNLTAELISLGGVSSEIEVIDAFARNLVQSFRAINSRLGNFSQDLLLDRVQAEVQRQAQTQATAVIVNALGDSGFIHDAI